MIRTALQTDLKALVELEDSVFSKEDFGLSRSSFFYHIKNNSLFVFEEDEKLIGYCLWLQRKSYHRLYSLCIATKHQGKGIAQKLLEYSFKNLPMKSYKLEVKIINQKAIMLYEKYGFKVVKTLKNYYPNNIDGYLMAKDDNAITLQDTL